MSNKEKEHHLPRQTKTPAKEKEWQIDPFGSLDESTKYIQNYRKKEDARKKNGKSGFDEWSVSWP